MQDQQPADRIELPRDGAARRGPPRAVLVAGGTLLTLAGLVVAVVLVRRSRGEPAEQEEVRRREEPPFREHPLASLKRMMAGAQGLKQFWGDASHLRRLGAELRTRRANQPPPVP